MLKLLLLVLPLGLDTLAVSAALGTRGLSRVERIRVSLVLSGFETTMPVLGLLLGRAVGSIVGSGADDIAIAALGLLGLWMLRRTDDDEASRVPQLVRGRALAVLALGISVSLDELAMGVTIGLLRLTLWLAIAVIGAQAVLVAQAGLRLGARLNEAFRERAGRLVGLALVALALLLVGEKLT